MAGSHRSAAVLASLVLIAFGTAVPFLLPGAHATDPPPTAPQLTIVRAPAFNPAHPLRGRVALFDENDVIVHSWVSPQPNDLFGLSAILVPDVNGDGISDVAIAAPNAFDNVAGARVGTVLIASGANGSTIVTLSGTPLERFGLALFSAPGANANDPPVVTTLVEGLDPATGAPMGVYTFRSFNAFTGTLVAETAEASAGMTREAAEASLAMYVRAAGPADLDASGVVTLEDFTILANNFGTTIDPIIGGLLANDPTLAAAPTGDTNGDGVVDQQDLGVVAGSMGQNFNPGVQPSGDVLTEAEAAAVVLGFEQATGHTLTSTNCPICAIGIKKVKPVLPFQPLDDNNPPDHGGGGDACNDPTYTGNRDHCDDDNDGKPNSTDDDDDGDGIDDASDPDHDGDNDGIPNDADTDDDGDGIPDSEDGDHPSNGYSFGSGGGGGGDPDSDQDGIPDYADCDSPDYSGNALEDCACQDEDNDGIWNQDECDSPCPDQRACCEHAWIDIRTDTNNDHAISSADEQAEWESPGAIICACTWDSDRDGIEDFLDGYDLFGSGETRDDRDSPTHWVPLVVSMGCWDQDETVRVTFYLVRPDDLDPSPPWAINCSHDNAEQYLDPITNAYSPLRPRAHCRLWRVEQPSGMRDPLHVSNGGDFVPFNCALSPADLGIGPTGGTTTLWIECLSAYGMSSDQQIRAFVGTIDPDYNVYADDDRVAITGTEIRVSSYDLNRLPPSWTHLWWDDSSGVLVPFGQFESEQYVQGSSADIVPLQRVCQISIYDPRESGLDHVTLGDHVLPLSRISDSYDWYASPMFVWVHPDDPTPILTRPQILKLSFDPNRAWNEISYTLSGLIAIAQQGNDADNKVFVPTTRQLKKVEKLQAELVQYVIEQAQQMEASGWVPDIPGDGKFGQEIHARVNAQYGSHNRWVTDIYVEWPANADEFTDADWAAWQPKIKRMNGVSAPGFTMGSCKQLDIALSVDPNYHPQLDQVWDRTRMKVYDVTTAAKILDDQGNVKKAERLAELGRYDREAKAIMVNSKRAYRASGWIDVPRVKTKWKTLAVIAGVAISSYEMTQIAQAYMTTAEEDDDLIELQKQYDLVQAETRPLEKKFKTMDAMGLLQNYMSKYTESGSADVARVISYYKMCQILAEP